LAADNVRSLQEGIAMYPKINLMTTLHVDPSWKADYSSESKRGFSHTLCKGLMFKRW